MKCLNLCPMKKNAIINMSSAEYTHRVVKVKN